MRPWLVKQTDKQTDSISEYLIVILNYSCICGGGTLNYGIKSFSWLLNLKCAHYFLWKASWLIGGLILTFQPKLA